MSASLAAVDQTDLRGLTVAVLGGTGPQGRGLAGRFAAAGLDVVVGSRSAARAATTASLLGPGVRGTTNDEAAALGDVVLVVVPWQGHVELLAPLADVLAGKVVVDCVNPLGFDRGGAHPLPVPEGSATLQAAAVLPRSRVVGAFHNVGAVLLEDPEVDRVETDVLVLSDDRQAALLVQALADVVPGMRGVHAGGLRNARQVEALTANLIAVDRDHKAYVESLPDDTDTGATTAPEPVVSRWCLRCPWPASARSPSAGSGWCPRRSA